jgi:hypothetical protein
VAEWTCGMCAAKGPIFGQRRPNDRVLCNFDRHSRKTTTTCPRSITEVQIDANWTRWDGTRWMLYKLMTFRREFEAALTQDTARSE